MIDQQVRVSLREFLGHVLTGILLWILGIASGALTLIWFLRPVTGWSLDVAPPWLTFLVFAIALVYGYFNAFRAYHDLRMRSGEQPVDPLRRLAVIDGELVSLWSVLGNTATWDRDPTYYRDRCMRAFESVREAVAEDWSGYSPELSRITREPGPAPHPGWHESQDFRRTLDAYHRLLESVLTTNRDRR